MCGFVGYWDPRARFSKEQLEGHVGAMAQLMNMRGPDAGGSWVDESKGLALGHRRLSILDLSTAGTQPMVSCSGRSVISYNGEIYNFQELRDQLRGAGHSFRSNTDTEVLLEACESWGVEEALRRANGMFGFALWDRTKQTLTVARDRVGIKPAFWSVVNQTLFFGSQVTSFLKHPGFDGAYDPNSLLQYLRFKYFPVPHTPFKGVHQVRPGHYLVFDSSLCPMEKKYWAPSWQGDIQDARSRESYEEEFEELFQDSVKKRMISDVPVGAFLSGGVDSSCVVSSMQAIHSEPVKTFSIGFHEEAFNEAHYAEAVAQHIGTKHEQRMVTPSDALDVVNHLPSWLDSPIADVAVIPNYLVAKLAQGKVTVVLSGDGGDELFAGYNTYLRAFKILKGRNRLPALLRRGLSSVMRQGSVSQWNWLAQWLPDALGEKMSGERMHKMADLFDAPDASSFYRKMSSRNLVSREAVLGVNDELWPEVFSQDEMLAPLSSPEDLVRCMQWIDYSSYLPDNILTKVDRTSMAVSLEARVPLLDHRIVEFAFRLPASFAWQTPDTKSLLRMLLYKSVPKKLIERPKKGFGVPMEEWIKGPLRDLAEDALSETRLKREGLFDPKYVRGWWDEHLSGYRRHTGLIWALVVFHLWKTHWEQEQESDHL